jgi:hypothetical protein
MACVPIAFFQHVQKLVFTFIGCRFPLCNRLPVHGLCHFVNFVFHLVLLLWFAFTFPVVRMGALGYGRPLQLAAHPRHHTENQ